jgi:polysaccharide pyruvyl transferase WcaK-like protein
VTRVIVLHAYSAANKGDGLLVEEAIGIVREALGTEVEITLVSSHPASFEYLGLRTVCSQPTRRGYQRDYLRLLRSLDHADLVVAVGGGYLRAGHPMEFAKAALVHGPQLLAASRTRTPTVYLPQSIGPLRGGTRGAVTALLRRMDTVYVRDDRSLHELSGARVRRAPDLALLAPGRRALSAQPGARVPVLSVRAVRGRVPAGIGVLADLMGEFDGYVQSAVGSNDDTEAVRACRPRSVLSPDELFAPQAEPRVVVAVRLHAALMCLAAGHHVIHLAYERKGFGAFQDLGLSEYVHNVNDFDPEVVWDQVRELSLPGEARQLYLERVDSAREAGVGTRASIVADVRRVVAAT